jgi:DnaK suppressor protein
VEEELLKGFRDRLVAMRDEIREAGQVKLDPNKTDPVAKKDDDGQPLNEMHQAIASSRNRARLGSLREVEAALARIEEEPEDYGLCEDCEKPIKPRRLELMPYAPLCVRCQSDREDPIGGARRNLRDYI